MYGHLDVVQTQPPNDHITFLNLLILTFLNCRFSVKTSLINTKLGDFVNLGVLFSDYVDE